MKTITKEPRKGNPSPRLIEISSQEALLNSLGLPGSGIHEFCKSLHFKSNSFLIKSPHPIGLSIGGSNVEEYTYNLSLLEKTCRQMVKKNHEEKFFFELNISCPNVKHSQDLFQQKKMIKKILNSIKQSTTCVIGIKLSPDYNNQDLQDFAEIVASFPQTYLNLGNTSRRTCDSLGLHESALAYGVGGLSGRPLYLRTLEMIELISPYKIPLIATGGISEISHIRQLRKSGALLMGIATLLVRDLYQIPSINQELDKNPLPSL